MDVKLIALSQYFGRNGAEGLIEHAGRVCFRSESCGDPATFIRARMEQGHESILEHSSATFEISGISRACSHQLVRHRLASYSQESQRHVIMDNIEFVCPDSIAKNPEAQAIWDSFMCKARKTYQALLLLGVRKEDARFVLPNATPTRIVVTMNFRELLHFFRLRLAPDAQWEIREMAMQMLKLVEPFAPSVFGDMLEEYDD